MGPSPSPRERERERERSKPKGSGLDRQLGQVGRACLSGLGMTHPDCDPCPLHLIAMMKIYSGLSND
jgi:hypothetical protein